VILPSLIGASHLFTLEKEGLGFDEVVSTYSSWQQSHRDGILGQNSSEGAIVFVPLAGLGDSFTALAAAFVQAVQTGRLFFVSFPFQWELVLKNPPFDWTYPTGACKTEESCNDSSYENNENVLVIKGHMTDAHPALRLPVVNSLDFLKHISEDRLMNYLFIPTAQVLSVMSSIRPQAGGTMVPADTDYWISLVVRTGGSDWIRFLEEGDEERFIKCARDFVETSEEFKEALKLKYTNDDNTGGVRIFVASDDETVKAKVTKALGDLNVTYIPDSFAHTSSGSQIDEEKLIKTFAEFFLISQSDCLFLTNGSLFGRVAGRLGSVPSFYQFVVSSSACRRAKVYFPCSSPEVPSFCLGAVHDAKGRGSVVGKDEL